MHSNEEINPCITTGVPTFLAETLEPIRQVGRYQIIAIKAHPHENAFSQEHILLLDTTTGDTKRLVAKWDKETDNWVHEWVLLNERSNNAAAENRAS